MAVCFHLPVSVSYTPTDRLTPFVNTVLELYFYMTKCCVNEYLYRKLPTIVNRRSSVLFHDNTRLYTESIMQEKILDLGWPVLPFK